LGTLLGVATEESKQMSGGIASAGGDIAKEEPDLINNSRRRAAMAMVIEAIALA
jgi:hypothetical protein